MLYYRTKTAYFVRNFKIKTLRAIVREFDLGCSSYREKSALISAIEHAVDSDKITKSEIWTVALSLNLEKVNHSDSVSRNLLKQSS